MKDFDQFFADDLRNGGEFKPSNDGWQRIAERLDTEGGRTGHVRTYWLAGLSILLLLGMGGYIFHLQQELKAIKDEISALKNTSPVRAGFTPAPGPNNQISLINTNNRFLLDRAGVNPAPDINANTHFPFDRAEVNPAPDINANTHFSLDRAEVNPAPDINANTRFPFDRAEVNPAPDINANTHFLLDRAEVNHAPDINTNTHFPFDRAEVNPAPDINTNTRFPFDRAEVNPAPDINANTRFPFDRAGVNPAPTATATPHPVSSINRPARPEAPIYPLPPLTKPHKTHTWQFGLAAQVYGGSIEHDVWNDGVGLGGALQYALTRHLRLTGDISFLKNDYSFEDRQHTDLPIPQPPSPDYRWHGAVGRQWGAEVGVGLKYQFRPDKRNKPYLSMGFAGNYGSDVRIHHIFENEQTEKNLKIEEEAIQIDHVKLLFKPALGYTAKWRRATWNIELFSRISPHERSRESFHQAGIRLERIF